MLMNDQREGTNIKAISVTTDLLANFNDDVRIIALACPIESFGCAYHCM